MKTPNEFNLDRFQPLTEEERAEMLQYLEMITAGPAQAALSGPAPLPAIDALRRYEVTLRQALAK